MASISFKNVVLLLLLFHITIICDAISLKPHKALVWMRNDISIDLGSSTNLTVDCKSKEDDLGFQYLAPTKGYGFTFRPRYWGWTLFFCRYEWPGSSHYFDIYDQERDQKKGNNFCWTVRQNGPCRCKCSDNCTTFDQSLCFPWNEDPFN
ncbi:hypothetical protein UlMin_010209 [Ulmus minor]